MSALWLVTTIVIALALLLWVGFVQERYALSDDQPTAIEVVTPDGWVIHAHHRAAPDRKFIEPVVLCHGLANNFSFFELNPPANLARFLTNLGFDTYCIGHRGDPSSVPPDWPVDADFDDLVRLDVPSILKAVSVHSGQQRVLWVGHSLGGLLGLASAAITPTIVGVVTIGAPVFFKLHHAYTRLLKLGQWLSPSGLLPVDCVARVLAPFAARIEPGQWGDVSANLQNIDALSQRMVLANATSPVWRGVLRQLEDWVRHNAFRSRDFKTDYRAQTKALQRPLLVCAGTVDRLAPLSISREYFDLLTTPDKCFEGFGKEFGQREDYGHGDLVIGRLAHLDVYPVIGRWLVARATPR
jgi:pimeloyl-ACP methyl ester carboxylesterase